MMLISIHHSDDRPIYQQIIDQIRRAVALDLLRPEEPLPSVRQLSMDLRVNPNTVQRAYRELERDGLVYAQRGRGTFVTELGAGQRQRQELIRDVARSALREAQRNGLTADELLEALRVEARDTESS